MLSKTERLKIDIAAGAKPPPHAPREEWTDEHVDWVIAYLGLGYSVRKIGPQFGASGSAIIGLIHRDERLAAWRDRPTHPKVKAVSRSEWKAIRKKAEADASKAPRRLVGPSTDPSGWSPEPNIVRQANRLYRLSEGPGQIDVTEVDGCREVYGTPGEGDWTFCGRKRVPGLSYCEFHARRNTRLHIATRRAPPCCDTSPSTSLTPSGTSSGSSGQDLPSEASASAG